MINLDYASHTPVDEAVLAEFCRVERECHGNALSIHSAGREALAEMERATVGIAALIGVKPSEIIYTSGASEANNLAIKGIARAYAYKGRHILSTCLEHPSVSGTLSYLQESGYEVELLKILPNGKIDLSHLKAAIRPDTVLLCVSAVDSELGAIQPLESIAKLISEYPNCHLHVDAAQAIGKIPVFTEGASTLCFSPHKFYGLGGFGVLVKREGVVLEPLIHGGGSLYRGGTPSPAMAAACHKALDLALTNQNKRVAKARQLHEYTLKCLQQYPLVRINSPIDGSPYILNLSIKGVKATNFTKMLYTHGVCVSIKSACSTDNAPSRPVMAVTNDKKNAQSSWRISFSHLTEMPEIEAFMSIFEDCYNNLSSTE